MYGYEGEEYGWRDGSLYMLGRLVGGFTRLRHRPSQNVEMIYGKGDEPRAIGLGNLSYEGELELLKSEYDAILASQLGQGKRGALRLKPFTLSFTYLDERNVPQTDTLVGVKFTSVGKEIAQGQTHQRIALPFMCARILEDV